MAAPLVHQIDLKISGRGERFIISLPPAACGGEFACAIATEHAGLVVGQNTGVTVALSRRNPNLGLRDITGFTLNAHGFYFRIRIHQRPAKVWQAAVVIRRLYINAIGGGG